ncbi:MAG: helix-turn-helix domain-containing protein [Candidatus Sulfotelmatobacter sp.]|jgi:DNA-binding NtrC family response regulator
MNRVLVVDDEAGMRAALEAHFVRRDWRVDTAANADEALDDCLRAGVLRAGVSLENMERRLVEMTLEATGGNRSRAAELLGVSLRTVRNKIRSYGLPSWSGYVHD